MPLGVLLIKSVQAWPGPGFGFAASGRGGCGKVYYSERIPGNGCDTLYLLGSHVRGAAGGVWPALAVILQIG